MRIIACLPFLAAACGGDPSPAAHDAPAPVETGDAGDEPPPPFTNGASTLSGGAQAGDVDGPRGVARFANPVGVAVRDGRAYVADFDNGKIRAIDLATYETTTVVAQQGFSRPFALAFAPDGTLYATTDRDPSGAHSLMTGTVWRIDVAAHTATPVAAAIGRPRGLGVLADGRLVVSDYAHHVLSIVHPATGAVSRLAGAWDVPGMADATGGAARFSTPYGLAVRPDGTIVVADLANHRVRTVSPAGVVATYAGTGIAGHADGAAATAQFDQPQAVALADDGDLYVTDRNNFRVRRISGASVSTVAGNGTGGYLDHDDPLAAQLFGLEGLTVAPGSAMLYVADGGRGEDVPYNRVRQVRRTW